MKLILANNQSTQFVDFYDSVRRDHNVDFDYAAYDALLFHFDSDSSTPIRLEITSTGRQLSDYDGVYINGYLNTYELATATAICAVALGVPFVNDELADSASLSKLSMYAKLVAAGVSIPKTIAGTAKALASVTDFQFPAVLKRADADRGIDNFKVYNLEEVTSRLAEQTALSLWTLQAYVPNDGFYLVSYYLDKPAFCIFRSLEDRPDGDAQKAHMYKPKGGTNATLLPLPDVAPAVMDECHKALRAMKRQIGSVDCLYDPNTQKAFILEVNYNPQLVTITTLKEERLEAFVAAMRADWSQPS